MFKRSTAEMYFHRFQEFTERFTADVNDGLSSYFSDYLKAQRLVKSSRNLYIGLLRQTLTPLMPSFVG